MSISNQLIKQPEGRRKRAEALIQVTFAVLSVCLNHCFKAHLLHPVSHLTMFPVWVESVAVAKYQSLVNKGKICFFANFLAKLLHQNYDNYHKTASCLSCVVVLPFSFGNFRSLHGSPPFTCFLRCGTEKLVLTGFLSVFCLVQQRPLY